MYKSASRVKHRMQTSNRPGKKGAPALVTSPKRRRKKDQGGGGSDDYTEEILRAMAESRVPQVPQSVWEEVQRAGGPRKWAEIRGIALDTEGRKVVAAVPPRKVVIRRKGAREVEALETKFDHCVDRGAIVQPRIERVRRNGVVMGLTKRGRVRVFFHDGKERSFLPRELDLVEQVGSSEARDLLSREKAAREKRKVQKEPIRNGRGKPNEKRAKRKKRKKARVRLVQGGSPGLGKRH